MKELTQSETIEPLFVSVKEAARAVGVSPWTMYQLLDAEKIDSRYQGRRRLVVVESLKHYAANLSKYPETETA